MILIHTFLPIVLTLTFACTSTATCRHGPPLHALHHPSHRLQDDNTTTTPLEFCETACICARSPEYEECLEYLAEYQVTCTCTEQPDGSVVQTGVEACLTCVNGTDVCYFYNFTDTVEASVEDGTPEWAGFLQECVVIEGDEFCVSTADQNAPSPAPCTAVANGVKCNSCTGMFSDNPVFEMNCTNIVEGAFMTITEEGEPTGFVGIFEGLGVILSAEGEYVYPLCPGDPDFPANNSSSGTRSALGCMAMGAIGVVATLLV
jgi:hypothetical protein